MVFTRLLNCDLGPTTMKNESENRRLRPIDDGLGWQSISWQQWLSLFHCESTDNTTLPQIVTIKNEKWVAKMCKVEMVTVTSDTFGNDSPHNDRVWTNGESPQ